MPFQRLQQRQQLAIAQAGGGTATDLQLFHLSVIIEQPRLQRDLSVQLARVARRPVPPGAPIPVTGAAIAKPLARGNVDIERERPGNGIFVAQCRLFATGRLAEVRMELRRRRIAAVTLTWISGNGRGADPPDA